MSRLTPLPARRVIRALEKLGFQYQRQRGSHASYAHPDGRVVTVPIHPTRDVARGTLREIIKATGVTVDEFMDLG
jgi:predicted RNA binding protein YcfA (HicA-like mRNA interferase family)